MVVIKNAENAVANCVVGLPKPDIYAEDRVNDCEKERMKLVINESPNSDNALPLLCDWYMFLLGAVVRLRKVWL